MDVQWLVNGGFGLATIFGVYILNKITTDIARIEERMTDLPHQYVSKDDYRVDIAEIKAMLRDIHNDLKNKADK